MTPEEAYLFDLNGYLILREVLPRDLVRDLNGEIDRVEALSNEEAAALGAPRGYYREEGDQLPVDYSCPLLKCGEVFERLIDWPATVPSVEAMIGEPTRLDALHLLVRQSGRSTVFHHGYSELLSYSEFAVTNGEFKCVSVKIGYALTDVAVENGCFAVIPGSHKSSYANPYHLEEPDETHPLVQACPCKTGDAVIFSEDLTHGAVQNRSGKLRRTIFASYAPAFQAAWDDQLDMAEGFEERATLRQLELVQGPSPFGGAGGFNQGPVRNAASD